MRTPALHFAKQSAASRLALRGKAAPLTVVGAFFVSRVLAWICGVRYVADAPGVLYQLVDPHLLSTRLFQTILYLHTQPPLFNLAYGLVLKLSPLSVSLTFNLMAACLGLSMALALYDAAHQLGVNQWVSALVSIVISVSPDVILYENWLFYDYFDAVAIVILFAAAVRWRKGRSASSFTLVCVSASALVLTRALYHPVWLAGVFLILMPPLRGPARRPQRTVWCLAVASVALVSLVLVKDVILFGSSGLSSWTAINLNDTTTSQLHPEQIESLTKEGKLDSVWKLSGFAPWASYQPYVKDCPTTDRSIPILDEAQSSTGVPNYNFHCYLRLEKLFLHDDIASLEHAPLTVLAGQFDSWQRSMAPASTFPNVQHNEQHLRLYDEAFRRIVLLEVPLPRLMHSPNGDSGVGSAGLHDMGSFPPVQLTVVIATLAAIIGGLRAIRKLRTVEGALAVLVGFIVAWTFVLGNALEFPENARFKFDVEPLLLLTLGIGLYRLVCALWDRGRRRPHGSLTSSVAGLKAVG